MHRDHQLSGCAGLTLAQEGKVLLGMDSFVKVQPDKLNVMVRMKRPNTEKFNPAITCNLMAIRLVRVSFDLINFIKRNKVISPGSHRRFLCC